ncbi:MAG: Rne/Rng family ribonuclease [Planctomycetota bacterium]|nr:Rne/Rng family ribonuclease [Planctomycetota bacterium]
MAKEMLINVSEGEECRIALVENGRLDELYMERTSATSHVGNIYKGRVTNVEPSIQAAFVDFGLGRNGFLHISDLMPTYFGHKGDDVQESVGRKLARRDRPPIQRCLHRGDDIIVQIIKEGIGTKGPTLSTYISIPGRILVMMPGMSKLGVSRKIEDDEERRRLRQILDALKPPRDSGFIIRTAGIGKSKTDIQRDLQYLTRLWQNIEKKIASGPGPMELYTEGDLLTRTVRDVFTSDIARIIVDNKDIAHRVKEFIKIAMPRTKNKVDLYEDPIPLFHKYGIEKEIELMYSRHVPLPSGGSLVIDSTEAIVAIDVNSGKFRDHSDAEMTAFKTDLEAADEIPRQLRLRDLGGVIICDFIDLRYERHRRELEKRLDDNLANDRAKTKMLPMSQFGIIEMTRQRMRPSLKRSIYFDCPHCKGAGLVKTPESMALDVMRRLAIAISDQRVAHVELAVCPEVSYYLQNKKRSSLTALETRFGKHIIIRSDATLGMDAVRLELYDSRDGLVFLEALGMTPQAALGHPAPAQQRPSDPGRRDQQRHRDQRHRQQRDAQPPPRDREEREEEAAEDRFDIERVEEAIDEREQEQEKIAQAADSLVAPNRQPSNQSDRLAPAPETRETTEPVPPPHPKPLPQAQRHVPAPSPASPSAPAPAASESSHSRWRRGRRGRRGNEPQPQPVQRSATQAPTQPAPAPAPKPQPQPIKQASPPPPVIVQPAPKAPASEPPTQPKPARRRGSRGGQTTRKGRSRSKAAQASPDDNQASQHEPQAPAAPAPSTSVIRTGSSDRHLMQDEPILPQPLARPKTYRDLDSIPDDLD